MTVAKTILAQLGGNQFVALTGAKDFLGGVDFLKMKVGKNSKGVTHVKITLDPSDTYTMEFMKWNAKKLEMSTIYKTDGIYCDMLQDIFEEHTGLYTTLVPRR